MKRRPHAKSGLFLIELMICILFFAIMVAVFLQVFVKSYGISRQAEDLFQAQNRVASVAEILETSQNFSEDLRTYFPEMQIKDKQGQLSYDGDWQPVTNEKGDYVLTITWERKNKMWVVHLEVIALQTKKEIYHLDLQILRSEGGKNS